MKPGPRAQARGAVFIFGAGKVGTGLAMALENSHVPVAGLWNRSRPALQRAARTVSCPLLQGSSTKLRAFSRRADIVMVCVADGAISTIGQMLVEQDLLKPNAVVAHVSGALAHHELAGIGEHPTASLHPMVACSSVRQAAQDLQGAHFSLEGHPTAVQRLHRMVKGLDGTAHTLPAGNKARYHAACVLASNLVVALLDVAIKEACRAGLKDAAEPLALLAQGACRQVASLGTAGALTGPIARGDAGTVLAHLAQLDEHKAVYTLLSKQAVDLARRRKLPKVSASELLAALCAEHEANADG